MKNLKKNLSELNRINPYFNKWLDDQPDVEWLQIINPGTNANMVVRCGSDLVNAYPLDDPAKDAGTAVEKMNLFKENISVIVGFGLGYLCRAMLDKAEKGHKIIVAEPVGHVIRAALSQHDFSEELKSGRLTIAAGRAELIYTLHLFSNNYVISDWMLTTEKYSRFRQSEYKEITEAAQETINQIMCNTGTVAGTAGKFIADNDISCMPYVIRHRGVEELRGLFAGKPAILVSTGPSLAKNVHHLMELKDKAVIICVGQALRILLAYGIRPDFATTVDFGEVNIGHFKGLMDCGIPLVTINRTYAPLLKEWKGPKFIAATPVPGYEHMATGILSKKGFIEAGGSVAHLSFGLAQLLGCNPITFVGQDLAVGKTSHIPLADASGDIVVGQDGTINWAINDPRCPLTGKDKLYGMGYAHFVPGYFGQPVMTNMGLASFLSVFSNMVAAHIAANPGSKVFNSTQGGAEIGKAEPIMLRDYIDAYCRDAIDKTKLQALMSLADDAEELVGKVIPLLQDDIDNLDSIIKYSRIGLAASHGTRKLIERIMFKKLLTPKIEKHIVNSTKIAVAEHSNNPFEMNMAFYKYLLDKIKVKKIRALIKLSRTNYENSERAHFAAVKNPLVNVAIYGASRQIQGRHLKVDETFLNFMKNRQDALTRIDRNSIILTAARESAESLKKSYSKTLKTLKKYHKTKDESILAETRREFIDFQDVETFWEIGNWAHPLLDAEKALKEIESAVPEEDPPCSLTHKEVKAVLDKALKMREEAIQGAIKGEEETIEESRKLIQYNQLMKQAKERGNEKNKGFEEALKLLREANALMPEEMEARWGLATALHHVGNLDESAGEYKRLIDDFPDNHGFRFEYGQVLLKSGNIDAGMTEIKEAMSQTDAYDSFLFRIGEIYWSSGLKDEAITALELYLEKFPFDFNGWEKLGLCLADTGKKEESKRALDKAKALTNQK